MEEETIVINKSDLEELIAKEVAKKMTAQSNKSIFLDLAIIDKRVSEINRSYSEIVEYILEQSRKPPAYWENYSNLIQNRNKYGKGFNMTKPSLYFDPDTLIKKLVCLMFGVKNVKDLDGRDIKTAREVYSDISKLFLTTYEHHVNNIVDDRQKAPDGNQALIKNN